MIDEEYFLSQTYELKEAESLKGKSLGMLYAGSDPIAEAEVDLESREFTCKCVYNDEAVTISGTAEDDVTELSGTLNEGD